MLTIPSFLLMLQNAEVDKGWLIYYLVDLMLVFDRLLTGQLKLFFEQKISQAQYA